jgi:hypothetical protein
MSSIDGPGGSALIAIPTRIAAAVAGALLIASCQQASSPLPPVAAAPQAQATIEEYLRTVDGRFGALALAQDGTRATYYICQSRLWKNCDNYELNDRFVSVPSARLAAQEALSRCGGGCRILYLNDQRQR